MEEKKRFVDNGDETVTDSESNVMWKQTDSYQDTSKWVTWDEAHEYVNDLNVKIFGGYSDWRVPTREEAESLYLEDQFIRDVDRLEVYIDSAFSPGGGFTCWTTEERPHATAVVFQYRYGHANLSNKEGMSKESVRAVRTLT